MAGIVLPGYRGKINIAINASSAATDGDLGVKHADVDETIAKHNTNPPASPTTSTYKILQSTNINGAAQLRLNIQAQFGAQGTLDPPDFTGENLYGPQYVQMIYNGENISGYFNVEHYSDSFDTENGTIDYALGLLSNGPYVRTRS